MPFNVFMSINITTGIIDIKAVTYYIAARYA